MFLVLDGVLDDGVDVLNADFLVVADGYAMGEVLAFGHVEERWARGELAVFGG